MPFEDVAQALQQLHGVRIGILTNGFGDLQRMKLETSGLLPWFETVVISGEIGIGKPDPRAFEIALRELGADPNECLMVGDGLETDMGGAAAFGIRSVLLSRGSSQQERDGPVIASLSELAPLVEDMLQR